jgi:hypothetical protein
MSERMAERDDVTIRLLAVADGVSFAEARREALASYAAAVRDDEPWIAGAVDAVMRYRQRVRGNVVPLERSAR